MVHSSRDDLAAPALRAFGEKWAHDTLVMDQCFAIQYRHVVIGYDQVVVFLLQKGYALFAIFSLVKTYDAQLLQDTLNMVARQA